MARRDRDRFRLPNGTGMLCLASFVTATVVQGVADLMQKDPSAVAQAIVACAPGVVSLWIAAWAWLHRRWRPAFYALILPTLSPWLAPFLLLGSMLSFVAATVAFRRLRSDAVRLSQAAA